MAPSAPHSAVCWARGWPGRRRPLPPSTWPYALVYGLLVIVHSGIRLGRKTYVVDMAGADDRALYVALSNTITGVLMLAVGAFIGGLAQWLGTGPLMLVLAATAGLAALSARRLPEVEE